MVSVPSVYGDMARVTITVQKHVIVCDSNTKQKETSSVSSFIPDLARISRHP